MLLVYFLKNGEDLMKYIQSAKPLSGDNIVTISDLKSEVIQFLTSYDQFSGYKSISMEFFNENMSLFETFFEEYKDILEP